MDMRPALARLCVFVSCLPFAASGASAAEEPTKEERRLEACREVVRDVLGIDEEVPRDLIRKAECVVVVPGVKKAALGIGARFGYGAASCRTGRVSWSAPIMVSLKGGSFGLQIGGQEADLVLLFMNDKGLGYLLRNKFTLGADATVAAGPVGRTAEAATDAQLRAEILSYSRSRGVFAGISVEGAVLKPDDSANVEVYGRKVSAREVLTKPAKLVPKAARPLLDDLGALAPREP
jgi:lipid-binding SYLF domain-containing protein